MEMSAWGNAIRGTVRSGNFASEKCLQGTVRRGSVLEPIRTSSERKVVEHWVGDYFQNKYYNLVKKQYFLPLF